MAQASKTSLLLIGKPGVGKTTLLRELAAALSTDRKLIVVVVDKVGRRAGLSSAGREVRVRNAQGSGHSHT